MVHITAMMNVIVNNRIAVFLKSVAQTFYENYIPKFPVSVTRKLYPYKVSDLVQENHRAYPHSTRV